MRSILKAPMASAAYTFSSVKFIFLNEKAILTHLVFLDPVPSAAYKASLCFHFTFLKERPA